MEKVIVFGVGKNYQEFKSSIQQEYEIVCLVDNNYKKILGEHVYPPCEIRKRTFDYVVITPTCYEDIWKQLVELGVEKRKIKVLSIKPEDYKKPGGYFGQHGEDLIVTVLFARLGIEKPSYLDVGANRPFTDNNTAQLYLNGCKGLCIEPNIEEYHMLEVARPKDTNINIGIGTEATELPFYICGASSQLNTFCKENVERFPGDKEPKIIKLPVVKLETIISQYCPEGFPDYLDIDIEGLDYEVLQSFDFSDDGPKVICTEVRSVDIEKFDKLLDEKGYFRFCRIVSNHFYVRKEYSKAVIGMEY